MTVSEALAEVLTREAKHKGKSARWMGEQAGNRNAVFTLRKNGNITTDSLWKMADALGVSVMYLAMRVDNLRSDR